MNDSFSEDELLDRLFPLMGQKDRVLVPPGDDCAVFETGGANLAVTVDQVIESRHYLPQTSPYAVGRKLMARNLSDAAAMGAKPLYALIASATCGKTAKWLIDFHRGVIDEGAKFGVTVIGGDLASTKSETVSSLTLIATVEGHGLLRSGARSGDAIFVTGELGASLQSGHHLEFQPRVKEGLWLNDYATAMIDITDGLIMDLNRVCRQSGVAASLNLQAMPLRTVDETLVSLKNALTDGEDYELLFAVPQAKVNFLKDEWPFSTKLSMVGRFLNTEPYCVVDESGTDLTMKYGKGFDHFR